MNRAITITLILVAIFVSICITAGLNVWGLCLNLEIKPVELALLLVNVYIAVFLQYYLATHIPDRRAEKDIILEYFKDASLILRNCRDHFLACFDAGKITKQKKTAILGELRRFSNSVDALETAILHCRVSNCGDAFKRIRNEYIAYKGVLTGGSFPSKPYGPEVYVEHDRVYRALDSEVQSLRFKINKQH